MSCGMPTVLILVVYQVNASKIGKLKKFIKKHLMRVGTGFVEHHHFCSVPHEDLSHGNTWKYGIKTSFSLPDLIDY